MTDNNIWGEASNPHNILRTPGGSSGGDSGLVSSRCVPIGIGGDIGGSLRYPASFTGICTLKPTVLRTSLKGI